MCNDKNNLPRVCFCFVFIYVLSEDKFSKFPKVLLQYSLFFPTKDEKNLVLGCGSYVGYPSTMPTYCCELNNHNILAIHSPKQTGDQGLTCEIVAAVTGFLLFLLLEF